MGKEVTHRIMYYKIPSYKMPQRDKLQEMKFSAEKRETREGEVD